MPPKRKAPLTTADANELVAPPVKKTFKGKKAADAVAPAVVKKYKFSEPSTMANQGPVDVTFIQWSTSDDDEDEENNDEEDENEDKPEPGSLQEILNGIANEKAAAVSKALEPVRSKGIVRVSELHDVKEKASKPFDKKMDEARKKFVEAKKMTEEEAKAIVGQNDEERKRKRRVKKRIQGKLNEIQRERNKAVHEVLNSDGARSMTIGDGRARIAAAEKPFLEKMEKVRKAAIKYSSLTAEEVNAIKHNVELDDEGNEIIKKSEAQLRKEAEEAAFVPPRAVTEKGFPVSKAAFQKFIEINQEIEKRDPDMHRMYIYNDFAGYGVTEVMENMFVEFNKLIFKKDVSPIKKWALVEGLTLYLAMGCHMHWMMNEDYEAVEECLNIMGVMYITALEMLHEHALIGPTSPLPDNVGIMTLHFIDFMSNTCSDSDLEWVHEVVRAADKYGVVLTPVQQIKGVDQDMLDELRGECEETKIKKGLAWKTEFPKFKRNHPGGHKYDITKMSKAEKAQYEFDSMSEGSEGDESD